MKGKDLDNDPNIIKIEISKVKLSIIIAVILAIATIILLIKKV